MFAIGTGKMCRKQFSTVFKNNRNIWTHSILLTEIMHKFVHGNENGKSWSTPYM